MGVAISSVFNIVKEYKSTNQALLSLERKKKESKWGGGKRN
jgi:hypothetical protein